MHSEKTGKGKMTTGLNCWDSKKCGKEKTADCPVVLRKAGDHCWLVAGTFCGSIPECIFVAEVGSCFRCDFYLQVRGRTTPLPG